jgi:hypothetical protein
MNPFHISLPISVTYILILSFHLCLDLPSSLLGVPYMQFSDILFALHALPPPIAVSYLIALIIFGEQYNDEAFCCNEI